MWQLLGSILVERNQWHYSNPVPNDCKKIRLRSFSLPVSGRATYCLYLPDGKQDFKRFYPDSEPVLFDLPEPFITRWRRVGLRGTNAMRGVWLVNIELFG